MLWTLGVIVGAGTLAGCGSTPDRRAGEPAERRGDLMSMEPIAGGEESGPAAYELRYRTGTSGGPDVTASALLLVPERVTSTALVSYQHSSAVASDDVPTVRGTPHWEAAVTLARSGRVVVAADYLGLGAAPAPHPWLDAETEARATVDVLRAVPDALASLSLDEPTGLDLVGFSQGAHATMALARSLAADPLPALPLRTVVGIAGPYRLDAVDVPALVEGTSDPAVRSLALARLAYTAALRSSDGDQMLDDLLAPGWRSRVPALFDGTHTDVEVATTLPGDPAEVFSDQGWATLTEQTGEFGRWLARTSSVCDDWATSAPVHLLHAHGDTSALPRNTDLCAVSLRASGVTVSVEDLGDDDHIASGRAGIRRARQILAAVDGTAPAER
jgi:pimeloyl-ACP methyl ester carboxylesterase